MTTPKRPILKLSKAAKIPAELLKIDYRVVWNEAAAQWDIRRNGVDTKNSRRKRQSAIDLAILKAKAEQETAKGTITVATLEDGKAKMQWTSEGGAGQSA